MSELSRHRPYLVWGVVLVAAAVVLVLALVPSGSWVALDQRRSATRVTPDGVAAWARSMEALGVPVAERYLPFTSEPPRGRGLVLLEPIVPPSAREVREVLEWVRAGGTLVYSPTFPGLLADSLGLALPLLELDAFGVPVSARDSLLAHRWTVEDLTGPTHASVGLSADTERELSWVPLVLTTGDELPTLAWVPEGEGGVLAISDAVDLSNEVLAESVVALTVTRAVADRLAGDTLFFSEYHQALDGSGGPIRETLRLARSTRVGRAVLHLSLAAVVLLLLTGRRFGEPLPDVDDHRRSTLEHVEALAGIYRAADSDLLTARRLIRGTARRLGVLHPSGGDAEGEVLESWRSKPELAEAADAARAALDAIPPDLVALERALDTITARSTTTKS